MNLENVLFKRDYHYQSAFINKCITIIKFSKDTRRVSAFKKLVFYMMKDIVKKNICNYLNMLGKLNLKDELPDRDELIADCYILFEKCLGKYNIHRSHNFYFYFNKSLSRNFFRDYQRGFKETAKVEITEAIVTVIPKFHNKDVEYDTELLMDTLGFNEIEKRVCRSRMLGQRTSEFLASNTDVTSTQYSNILKKVKECLTKLRNNGEL